MYEKLELVSPQPSMGGAPSERGVELRIFPFGRHVIVCASVEGGVDAVRLLHGARDVGAAFGEELQSANDCSKIDSQAPF